MTLTWRAARVDPPNGTTLSMERGVNGWKVDSSKIQGIFDNVKDELRNDPKAKELFKNGKQDEVWDMMFMIIADKIGGKYTSIRK